MTEFEKELALIEQQGLKTSPLRAAYEQKARELRRLPEKLTPEGFRQWYLTRKDRPSGGSPR